MNNINREEGGSLRLVMTLKQGERGLYAPHYCHKAGRREGSMRLIISLKTGRIEGYMRLIPYLIPGCT